MTPLTNEQLREEIENIFSSSTATDSVALLSKEIAEYCISQITALKEQIRKEVNDLPTNYRSDAQECVLDFKNEVLSIESLKV